MGGTVRIDVIDLGHGISDGPRLRHTGERILVSIVVTHAVLDVGLPTEEIDLSEPDVVYGAFLASDVVCDDQGAWSGIIEHGSKSNRPAPVIGDLGLDTLGGDIDSHRMARNAGPAYV
jgi:hypothetical protein